MKNASPDRDNKPRLLIVNDNKLGPYDQGYKFSASNFHLFLAAFSRFDVTLSSPVTLGLPQVQELTVDGINVRTRPGYGSTKNFYTKLPLHASRQVRTLRQHMISSADIVMIVLPACTAPLTYAIARSLKKPILLYIVGDVHKIVTGGDLHTGLSGSFAKKLAGWELGFTRWLAKRNEVLVLGSDMHEKIIDVAPHARLAMTSLVKKASVQSPRLVALGKPVKLFTAGRLSSEKSIGSALEALSKLTRTGYQLHYTIAGHGPEREALQSHVESLGLEKHVTFTGWLDNRDIQKIHRESDIFLLPSLSEGIPKVLLDAMASGQSVIGSLTGGIPDLIGADQQNGWLVSPGNAGDLAKAIKECIDDDDLRFKKQRNAHEYIQNHTMEAEAERIQDILMDRLAPGGTK